MTIYYTCVSINTIVQPDTFRSQVSRLGTESFILMVLLLATLLSCESAKSIIDNIKLSTANRGELVEVIQEATEKECFEDAKADYRNGVKPLLLWRKPMAQVTYRGVQYDTNERKQTQSQKSELTYRGVKFNKELVSA